MTESIRKPTLIQALMPIAVLVVLLITAITLFGDNAIAGPNQMALLMAAACAAIIGRYNGHSWDALTASINRGIHNAMGAIVILLSVGSLIGVWILSGTVPSMIYFGLSLLNAEWFYLSACIISALVSISIGSSWTTAGTIGVGLMGVAMTMGLSEPMAAGAIISGAYFGDKMSPLSDTTNLAPSVSGSDLFTHIRHLVWTTFPSFFLALIFFSVVGEPNAGADLEHLQSIALLIDNTFNVGWYLLIPLPVLLYVVARPLPALPSIWIGIFVGILFVVFFQLDNAAVLAGADVTNFTSVFSGIWIALTDGFALQSGTSEVDDLLSKGGMSSMLNTVWLIMCAMSFGGLMERVGLLETLVAQILKIAKSTQSLVSSVIVSAFAANVITSDQYISIVLPGRMFKSAFEKMKLHPVNLSRALEDGGTVTSPLVPWNSCGAYMSATLGVATVSYAPFAIFCLINPIIAIISALLLFKIVPADELEK
jgi:NhaC family Na+:H+ antiporter